MGKRLARGGISGFDALQQNFQDVTQLGQLVERSTRPAPLNDRLKIAGASVPGTGNVMFGCGFDDAGNEPAGNRELAAQLTVLNGPLFVPLEQILQFGGFQTERERSIPKDDASTILPF